MPLPSTIPPLLIVALHTLVIYLALILGLRLIGRRQLSQLTVIDLVIIILLGSAVETAMVAANTTLPAGLVSAGVLFLTNRILSFVSLRSDRLRRLVAGETLLLVNDGQVLDENLRRAGLTEADLVEALHERGQADTSTVRYAVREADGSINVIPREEATETLKNDTVLGDRLQALSKIL